MFKLNKMNCFCTTWKVQKPLYNQKHECVNILVRKTTKQNCKPAAICKSFIKNQFQHVDFVSTLIAKKNYCNE
jgi:hypothetical protein